MGRRLLSLIALALNLDDQFFEKIGALNSPMAFLRLLHYPGTIMHLILNYVIEVPSAGSEPTWRLLTKRITSPYPSLIFLSCVISLYICYVLSNPMPSGLAVQLFSFCRVWEFIRLIIISEVGETFDGHYFRCFFLKYSNHCKILLNLLRCSCYDIVSNIAIQANWVHPTKVIMVRRPIQTTGW